METGGGQMVTLRGRQLETKPAVIPHATHHAVPAISHASPLGLGRLLPGKFLKVEKGKILVLRLFSRIATESSFSR